MMGDRSRRDLELDGTRGWAALLVACSHFFYATFHTRVPWLESPFLALVFDGEFMVMVFFVLSGHVLAGILDRDDDGFSLRRLAATRYFRLTFPVLVSCGLVWILMALGLVWNRKAGVLVGSGHWLGDFLGFPSSLAGMVRYSLDGVYFHHDPDKSYNPFLWTMSIELAGSALVFLNLFIFRRGPVLVRALWVQAAFFLFFEPYYALFYAGMLLRLRHSPSVVRSRIWTPLFILCGIVAAMSIAAWIRSHGSPGPLATILGNARFQGLGAVALVWCIRSFDVVATFFRTRLSVLLGEISFPLYVLQFPVLVSATSGAIVASHAAGLLTPGGCLAIATGSLLLSVLVAIGLRVIERRYLAFLSRFSRRILAN